MIVVRACSAISVHQSYFLEGTEGSWLIVEHRNLGTAVKGLTHDLWELAFNSALLFALCICMEGMYSFTPPDAYG